MGNSVIKQHEPLRVPEGWNQQERKLIFQLEELFDDIYKSFGRITLNDLQKDLKDTIQTVSTAYDNKLDKTSVYQTAEAIVTAAESYTNGVLNEYSTTIQTANMIGQFVVNSAYTKQSGITITAEGIDISGSQYVKIASGGYFQVTTGTFGIDSNASDYVLWAGAASPASAPFWLKKNGEIHAESGTFSGAINVNNGTFRVYSNGNLAIDTPSFKIFGQGAISYIDSTNLWRFNIGAENTSTGYSTISFVCKQAGLDYQQNLCFSLTDDSSSQIHTGELSFGVVYAARRELLSYSAQINWAYGIFPLVSSATGMCALGSSGHKFATVWSYEGNFTYCYADYLTYTTLLSSSSREVKHNIAPLGECGDMLDRLSPVSFVYNKDTHKRFGLIWEETEDIIPEICLEHGEKSINYMDLIPLLLREIQSLRGRVKELEACA